MASYVVMEPPVRAAEGATLVRDGFHIFAFILPVVWLLFHRLWVEALLVLVIGLIIGALGSWLEVGSAATVGSLMLAVFVGLEGSAMKVAALRRRGWREWGVVEAENAGDAEIRYASQLGETASVEDLPMVARVAAEPVRYGRQPVGPALGMLGYPARG